MELYLYLLTRQFEASGNLLKEDKTAISNLAMSKPTFNTFIKISQYYKLITKYKHCIFNHLVSMMTIYIFLIFRTITDRQTDRQATYIYRYYISVRFFESI